MNGKRLDPCTQIAESVGYSDEPENDIAIGSDALIAYKDALEDAVRGLCADPDEDKAWWCSEAARAAERIAEGVPSEDEWRSAADFMQHAAETLDIYGVARPKHYGYGE